MNLPESVTDRIVAAPQMHDVVQVPVAIRVYLVDAVKLRDLGGAELIEALLRDIGFAK